MRKPLGILLLWAAGLVAGTPVQEHGALKVAGNRIVDQAGQPVRLAGMSLFWPLWGGERFFTKEVVDTLVDDWRCTLLRAPVGVEPKGGYLESPGPMKAGLKVVVDEAIARGVYILIDWHEEHAHRHTAQAKAFFEEMARTYGDKPNVIFEIWNEPAGNSAPIPSWPEIKAYSEQVIAVIRKHSSNLVVVGTPEWSQRLDLAADHPVVGTNLAYSLHFYAGSHGQPLRDKADYALSKGLAIFITEWGTTHADGGSSDRKVYTEASAQWLAWADQRQIPWANWSLMDKDESSSALLPGASNKGAWPEVALSPSGRWVREQIRKRSSPPATPATR